jgi:hypothetical protein
MYLSPFSGKKSRKPYLSALLLTFVVSAGSLPVVAQSPNRLAITEIAQSSDDADTQALQRQAEKFVELLGKKDYATARALLEPKLQAYWSVEKIKDLWEQDLLPHEGAFIKIVGSEVNDIINAYVVKVKVQFEKRTDNLYLTFNKKQQLIGLNFPKNKTISEKAEEFVSALAANDFARARGNLNPALKAEVFPKRIRQGWEDLLKKTGPYKRQVKTEVQPSTSPGGVDLVLVTIEFEKVTDNAFILFDSNGTIVGVDFPEIN